MTSPSAPGSGSAHQRPLVSVIIPTYNAQLTLDETLASVRAQTYSRIEIIVVDDGSGDSSRDIVHRHAQADERVRLVLQSNLGVAAARNRGIIESRGSFIAPVDADDIWARDKLERQLALFAADPSLGLVYSWYSVIDEDGWILFEESGINEEGRVFEKLLFRNFIGNGSSALIRREVLDDCGLYDPSLRERGAQGCEDYSLYLRIAERYPFGVVRQYLTGYRLARQNMSNNLLAMLESRRLCMVPYRHRYPEYGAIMDAGWKNFARFLLLRAFHLRNWSTALRLSGKLLRRDPRGGTHVLASLAGRFFRRKIAGAFRSRPPRRRPFLVSRMQ